MNLENSKETTRMNKGPNTCSIYKKNCILHTIKNTLKNEIKYYL